MEKEQAKLRAEQTMQAQRLEAEKEKARLTADLELKRQQLQMKSEKAKVKIAARAQEVELARQQSLAS